MSGCCGVSTVSWAKKRRARCGSVWLEGLEIDPSYLDYCTNCKTCEVTCPSGVKITAMILRAREKGLTQRSLINTGLEILC